MENCFQKGTQIQNFIPIRDFMLQNQIKLSKDMEWNTNNDYLKTGLCLYNFFLLIHDII